MQVLPFVAFAKGDITYTRLRSYYSDAGMLDVEKVVLSDTATVIHFTATGKVNAWFSFAPTTYLSDEKGARYSVKGAEGLELGEKCYVPKAGKTGFCLFFEPMPKETRIFDLIEGGEPGMFHIYGLHDAEAKVKIPVAEEATDTEETAESMFRPGKAVVRGRIEGYSRDWEDGILFFNLAETGDEASFTGRPCTLLQPDGTFCTELSLDCPVWTEMTLGNNHTEIPFYVRPGDTLDITVSGMRENGMTVEYASSHPKGGYEKLMECRDVPVIYYGWERLTDSGRDLNEENFLKRAYECVEENNFRFYGNPSVKNLAQDYESHPDLQLVAIVNRHAYSDKEGVERMIGELDFPEVHEADGESFLEMQELFRFSGSRKQMTFDRNELVFKQPLDMKDETLFRQRLRRILKAEEEFNH